MVLKVCTPSFLKITGRRIMSSRLHKEGKTHPRKKKKRDQPQKEMRKRDWNRGLSYFDARLRKGENA